LQGLPKVRTAEDYALLAQILKLLFTLIKYGYYDDPENIHEPLQHIFKILDDQVNLQLDEKAKHPKVSTRESSSITLAVKKQ
jgi:hypothetical protein